jgi:hypothetical protein
MPAISIWVCQPCASYARRYVAAAECIEFTSFVNNVYHRAAIAANMKVHASDAVITTTLQNAT